MRKIGNPLRCTENIHNGDPDAEKLTDLSFFTTNNYQKICHMPSMIFHATQCNYKRRTLAENEGEEELARKHSVRDWLFRRPSPFGLRRVPVARRGHPFLGCPPTLIRSITAMNNGNPANLRPFK